MRPIETYNEMKKEIESKRKENKEFVENLFSNNPEVNLELLEKKDRLLIELSQAEATLSQFIKDCKETKERLESLPIGNLKPSNESEILRTANAYCYKEIKKWIEQLKKPLEAEEKNGK